MTTRPRAADDHAAIRARMEELRRERAQGVDEQMDQTPSGPRLNYQRMSRVAEPERSPLLPRPIVRRVLG